MELFNIAFTIGAGLCCGIGTILGIAVLISIWILRKTDGKDD